MGCDKLSSILIVEDESSVNRAIEFTLSKENYTIYQAYDLKEADQIFGDHEIDMILCDINLPDGNGLEWIKKLRKHTNVPVIFLTALDQEMDQVMGYKAGADDYITKPFSLSVLVLKVNAFFKRNSQEENHYLESGMWRFYLDELYADNGENQVTFTKNEWKLLRILLEHPKIILSKGQILQNAFDNGEDFFDENMVAVYIRRLREKIEKDPADPKYIRNVRGMGYLWNQSCIKR